MTTVLQTIEEKKNELQDLISRARNVGYKNKIPNLPNPNKYTKNIDHLIIGFEYRLENWKNGLLNLENPSGRFSKRNSENINIYKPKDSNDNNYLSSLGEILKTKKLDLDEE